MVDLTALTLLPQEQLTLANSHELAELHRYRQLALSFLPTAPHTSRLLAALGMECEQRITQLQDVAKRMDLSACVATEIPQDLTRFNKPSNSFFVTDEAMGRRVLGQVLQAAQGSLNFYVWLLETNATPELHQPLLGFVNQKSSECRVIGEFQDQLHTSALMQRA